jgi:hypothetical protein
MTSKLSGIRFENGKFLLDGYPEGASVRGLGIPKAQELSRLHVFKSDLDNVCEWISLAKNFDPPDPKQEALYVAALIRFRACFEGTSGLRQKPLKQKDMFNSTDRACLERLRLIRNQMVAHDEHLYPGEYPLVVLDKNATAIEAVSFMIKVPFSGMSDVQDLERLAEIARKWIDAAYEEMATEIVAEINALTAEERLYLRDTTPEFTINMGPPEDRLKKS